MILQWFLSKTVRQAVAMRKHVHRILSAQRDILSPQAAAAVNVALNELDKAARATASKEALLKQMEALEKAANKWLKPYPNASWRENVEVLLVALAVAMSIRTFFLQPFKIPTGSMQPTLFGITSKPDLSRPPELGGNNELGEVPTGLNRLRDWFTGSSYFIYQADQDGSFDGMSRPFRLLIFNIKQTIWFAGRPHTIWFPPDSGSGLSFQTAGPQGLISALFAALPPDNEHAPDLERRMGLRRGTHYVKGQDVCRIKVITGDHLFVDRLTYNFRKPHRGEIIVFETAGIPEDMRDRYRIPSNEFYIKRLVGLPGERVQIGDDRHLIIDGRRLDAATPHFENVYGFDPKSPPHDSEYSGHVNGTVSQKYNLGLGIPPLFPDERTVYSVPGNYCMPMGDNTCNSSDSRFWGAIPEDYVIGKSFFVYWPLTKRFGIGQSATAQ